MMIRLPNRTALCACLLVALAGSAHAQDSVATTPGNSDALPAPDIHRTRYVVDLKPIAGSWGTPYFVGPVLKASADNDPMFSTQILGSSALSPDQLTSLIFAPTSYALWTAPGQGVNPTQNSAPGSVSISGYDRQFAIGLSDLSMSATNALGALVGQDTAAPSRLYVERVVAATSRPTLGGDDTATLSLGAIDAHGNLYFRADNFNAPSSISITGENILRAALPLRSNSVNTLLNVGSGNFVSDAAATSFVLNNEIVTTNTPACIPQSAAGSPLGAILDFAGKYRPNGGAGVTSHLASGIAAHRGNPAFSLQTASGVGTIASLARSTSGGGLVDSINLFSVNASGSVVWTGSATLPTNISDGVGFTTNSAGDAQFLQYLSQTSFRGGNGQAAVTRVGSTRMAAATATDPTDGEFIAVASFTGGTPAWTVAAHIGKPVLDGPTGNPIGTIAAFSPAALSAPGLDVLGNVYFTARFDPTVGPDTTGFFKAVNTGSGYRLELLLKAGDSIAGANSNRTYTIEDLFLADSDSIASGSFFSSSVLQPRLPGAPAALAADSHAFGGAIVGAKITYNNAGTPEPYQALLFIGPTTAAPPVGCAGDADGDGAVDIDDLTFVVLRLGNTPGPCGDGDVDGNGVVNIDDLTFVVLRLGTCDAPVCP